MDYIRPMQCCTCELHEANAEIRHKRSNTHHSNCGQPHSTGERLKEGKVVDGWLNGFLHDETETEVHKWLAKIDDQLTFCSYGYRKESHIFFLAETLYLTNKAMSSTFQA